MITSLEDLYGTKVHCRTDAECLIVQKKFEDLGGEPFSRNYPGGKKVHFYLLHRDQFMRYDSCEADSVPPVAARRIGGNARYFYFDKATGIGYCQDDESGQNFFETGSPEYRELQISDFVPVPDPTKEQVRTIAPIIMRLLSVVV